MKRYIVIALASLGLAAGVAPPWSYLLSDQLIASCKWKPYFLKRARSTLQLPCLVLAYRAGERVNSAHPSDQAVPVDIIELTNWTEKKALILPPGRYQLVLQNSTGNQQVLAVTQK